uniref:Uncharacterized protein n=1 Tax=Ditylum brightwellii TaxID=49249 RepID=A0A7S1ZQD2_9STRA
MIGGNGGSIVLLDVNKCTRKAFSTTLTPTVVRTWNMLRIMQKQRGISGALPSKKWLGVKKFCVWQDAWHTTFDDVNDGEGDGKLVNKKKQRNAGVVDVTVTCNCGWVLNIHIEPVSSRSMAHTTQSVLVHKTERIQYMNASNERLEMSSSVFSYCLPDIPTPASQFWSSSSYFCIGDVKSKKLVLPDKDKRILARPGGEVGTIQGLNSSNNDHEPNATDAILFIDRCWAQKDPASANREHGIVANIPLPYGPICSIAVNPSDEWIVVGYGRNPTGKMLELIRNFRHD